MTKPIETANPQDFKLSVCWVVGASTKMTAEFSNCRWLPRIDETLVLPIDESDSLDSWHRFKVVDVVYDFKKQCVRVWCKPLHSIPQRVASVFEKMEARVKATEAKERAEKLEFELVQVEDIDDELSRMKTQMMGTPPKSSSEPKAPPPSTHPLTSH